MKSRAENENSMKGERSLPNRIHIFGASGSGITSLASLISAKYGHLHLDTDDFYWLPTDPPFRHNRPARERLELLQGAMQECDSWILSGSVCRWGDPLIERFQLAVFMFLDPEIRMERLIAREVERRIWDRKKEAKASARSWRITEFRFSHRPTPPPRHFASNCWGQGSFLMRSRRRHGSARRPARPMTLNG